MFVVSCFLLLHTYFEVHACPREIHRAELKINMSISSENGKISNYAGLRPLVEYGITMAAVGTTKHLVHSSNGRKCPFPDRRRQGKDPCIVWIVQRNSAL